MSGNGEKYPHAVVVPSAGQGHVSGCMLLARSLAALGFRVTFVYFSTNYAKLKESNRLLLPYSSYIIQGGADLPPSSQSTANKAAGSGLIEIRVVEDGLRPGDIDKHFFASTPTMKENLFNLILELQEHHNPPTCLISDSFMPWTLHVAERAHIPRIDFWTSNAFSSLTVINFPTLFSQGVFPETGSGTRWKRETPLMLDHIPGLLPFSSEIYDPDMRFADPSHPWVPFFAEISSCSKYAERILIHTIPDIEVEAFRAYQVAGMLAYGIGPLLHNTEISQKHTPAASPQADGKAGVDGQEDSISWLNTQADLSVVYIAFGSFARLTAKDVQELALGIEASGSPFLWAIRDGQVLPEGFRERTSERGMVMGWAPQVEVLAHKAIGGFLTHCGWNSCLESLWEGVPLLCCPLVAEQRLNLNYLCKEWGVGLELERTETGGLERGFVEAGVKALMQEDAGRKARGKAQEVMELARKTCQPGGQSYTNLQKFYADMKQLCSESSSP